MNTISKRIKEIESLMKSMTVNEIKTAIVDEMAKHPRGEFYDEYLGLNDGVELEYALKHRNDTKFWKKNAKAVRFTFLDIDTVQNMETSERVMYHFTSENDKFDSGNIIQIVLNDENKIILVDETGGDCYNVNDPGVLAWALYEIRRGGGYWNDDYNR